MRRNKAQIDLRNQLMDLLKVQYRQLYCDSTVVHAQGGEERLKDFRQIVQAPSLSKTGLALDFRGFASGHVRRGPPPLLCTPTPRFSHAGGTLLSHMCHWQRSKLHYYPQQCMYVCRQHSNCYAPQALDCKA